MKIVRSDYKICPSCMEQHNVAVVEDEEQVEYKSVVITFTATYQYCPNTDEYFENEDMMRANKSAIIDAYPKKISTGD